MSALENSGINWQRQNIRRLWPALFFVVAVILFFRLPGAILRPAFYAEDGMVFFKQQYENGFLDALITPYAGYLHFTPRMVAGLCSRLPLEWLPCAYAIASLLIATAVLTFFIAPGFRPVIESDLVRAIVVVLFTVMPNTEPLMKLAYVNWYMLLFVALMTVFTLPERPFLLWLLFAAVVLAVWSSPVGIVCLPIIMWRVWKATSPVERWWWLAMVGSVIVYVLTAERPQGALHSLGHNSDAALAILRAIGYRVFCFFYLGAYNCRPSELLALLRPSEEWGLIPQASIFLAEMSAGAVVCAVVKWRSPGTARWYPVVLFYLILALPAMLVMRPNFKNDFIDFSTVTWWTGPRYFFCSGLLLCILGGVVYERVFRGYLPPRSRRRRATAFILLLWIYAHMLTFELKGWHAKTNWSHYAQEIRAPAEELSRRTGLPKQVNVQGIPDEFNFNIVVRPPNNTRSAAGPT